MRKDKFGMFVHIWYAVVALGVSITASLVCTQRDKLKEQEFENLAPEITVVSESTSPKVLVIEIEKPIETIVYEAEPETTLEFSEIDLMAKVLWCEARGEDFIGERLIADEILNRYYSDNFPNTISEVIYQVGQYSDFDTEAEAQEYFSWITYSDRELAAVYCELEKRIDTQVFYHRTGDYHKFGTRLYQHGNHYFSGE